MNHGDFHSFCIVTVIMLVWIEFVRIGSKLLKIPSWQQRKLLHIFTGPIFILTWPLFSNHLEGSIAAALVPGVMTLKFILVGLGLWKDEDMIRMSSRSGKREELLRGPTLYGIIFVLSTIIFWKTVSGIVYLFILCFGDGMAEVSGRMFGSSNPLFWSKRKSWAGFLGFQVFAYLATYLFLLFYGGMLFKTLPEQLVEVGRLRIRLLYDVMVAAVVETFPVEDIDNVTVFFSVAIFDIFSKYFI